MLISSDINFTEISRIMFDQVSRYHGPAWLTENLLSQVPTTVSSENTLDRTFHCIILHLRSWSAPAVSTGWVLEERVLSVHSQDSTWCLCCFSLISMSDPIKGRNQKMAVNGNTQIRREEKECQLETWK